MEEEREPTLKEEVRNLRELLEDSNKVKKKREPKIRGLNKLKLSNSKLKRNYIGVLAVHDNRNLEPMKVPIENGSYSIKGETYHATDAESIYFLKGKPIIIQPIGRKNPIKLLSGDNQTYGQEYIMARMMRDVIKPKRKLGGLIWIVIIGAGIAFLLFQSGILG